MNEWISVQERLPELTDKVEKYSFAAPVLAWPNDSGEVSIATYWNTGTWSEEPEGTSFESAPTHWMPLPEPPHP